MNKQLKLEPSAINSGLFAVGNEEVFSTSLQDNPANMSGSILGRFCSPQIAELSHSMMSPVHQAVRSPSVANKVQSQCLSWLKNSLH